MGQAFEVGTWNSIDELTDQLHKHFMASGLTDWLQIAERAISLYDRRSLSVRALLYAGCAQAWEGALQDFAARADLPAEPLLELMRDVREESVANFGRDFLAIIAHGKAQCDHPECWICNDGERPC